MKSFPLVRQVRGIGPFLRNVRDSESSPNSIVRERGNQGQAMFVVRLGTIREWAYSDGFQIVSLDYVAQGPP